MEGPVPGGSWARSRPGRPFPLGAEGESAPSPRIGRTQGPGIAMISSDGLWQSGSGRSVVPGTPAPSRTKPHRGGRKADAWVRSARALGSARRGRLGSFRAGPRVRSAPGRRRAGPPCRPPGRTGPNGGGRNLHARVRSAPRLGSARRGIGFVRRRGLGSLGAGARVRSADRPARHPIPGLERTHFPKPSTERAKRLTPIPPCRQKQCLTHSTYERTRTPSLPLARRWGRFAGHRDEDVGRPARGALHAEMRGTPRGGGLSKDPWPALRWWRQPRASARRLHLDQPVPSTDHDTRPGRPPANPPGEPVVMSGRADDP